MTKKVLLTGANGFLGQFIYNVLSDNFEVFKVGRGNANIVVDLTKDMPLLGHDYDLIIHSAGKAHSIPKTEKNKKEFFDVNVTGTKNLLKGLERSIPKSFVFISSVAVYGRQTGTFINEDQPLKALDAYGQSKIEAERIIQDWCQKHNVTCAILRLPLIAGPNPPGNLKAMINSIKKGYYFDVADGKAKKSIVMANDVAAIIPIAAQVGGVYNLTDGYHPSFFELSRSIAKQLQKPIPLNIPLWFANFLAKVGDIIGSKSPINSSKLAKITSDLTFDDSQARKLLEWKPNAVLDVFKIN